MCEDMTCLLTKLLDSPNFDLLVFIGTMGVVMMMVVMMVMIDCLLDLRFQYTFFLKISEPDTNNQRYHKASNHSPTGHFPRVPKCNKSRKMTIGLIIGAVNINAKAVCTGTPFLTN